MFILTWLKIILNFQKRVKYFILFTVDFDFCAGIRRCHTDILLENITEIMGIIISGFMGYLGALHVRGPEQLLGLVKPKIDQILGKGLSALLGEYGGKTAVAHIDRLATS